MEKKETQLSRITEYVKSLQHNQVGDDQQALILQSELTVIGGANSRCINEDNRSCNTRNPDCTNSGSYCGTNNPRCNNIPGKPGVPGAQ